MPVPQTGDDYLALLWIALAGLATYGAVMCGILLRRNKRKLLIGIITCAALAAVCAILAFAELRQYSDGVQTYADLEQFVIPSAPDRDTKPEPGDGADSEPDGPGEPRAASPSESTVTEANSPVAQPPVVDFAALREINPNIAGWLVMKDSPINYPIAQGPNNDYYLKRLFDGRRGKAGTPFLDFRNRSDFGDRNSVVYGHNLLDGSMFSCLTLYKEQDYYDAHPSMLLLTPRGDYRVEVFAAFVASPMEAGAVTSPWRQEWDTDGDFAAWLEQAKGRSAVQTNVTPNVDDKVLTLSTCINSGRDRFVVMGRLVRSE